MIAGHSLESLCSVHDDKSEVEGDWGTSRWVDFSCADLSISRFVEAHVLEVNVDRFS